MKKNGYAEISTCRAGGGDHLISVLNLGQQCLTGVFPTDPQQQPTKGPLELVWCPTSGLLQMRHSFQPSEMYGENYGYRSGLNQSMIDHLKSKANYLETFANARAGDVILDIGSNDGTLLSAYSTASVVRIGIDPTGEKFRKYYPPGISLVTDFFSAAAYNSTGAPRAKIVTSISMFYDLEDPIQFCKELASIMADDGIWHLEQSYMPMMLRTTSYDTICHEHLEYYSLQTLSFILEQSGLKIIDVAMNGVNGGSFAVTACKVSNQSYKPNNAVINWTLTQEERMGLSTTRPYRDFEERVFRHKADLTRLIRNINASGARIFGYGASTKGNVLLQFCGFTEADIPMIAEVNSDKFGHFTPGSSIPIVSEAQARQEKPDYFLVLPWHFKHGIIKREADFLNSGGRFIFPFPEIEIV